MVTSATRISRSASAKRARERCAEDVDVGVACCNCLVQKRSQTVREPQHYSVLALCPLDRARYVEPSEHSRWEHCEKRSAKATLVRVAPESGSCRLGRIGCASPPTAQPRRRACVSRGPLRRPRARGAQLGEKLLQRLCDRVG